MKKLIIDLLRDKFGIFIHRKLPRDVIIMLRRNLSYKLIGVEIGVFGGMNAKSILKTLDIKKIYLVDPYKEYKDCPDIGATQQSLTLQKNLSYIRLENYKDKIERICMDSSDAASYIPDNLDFVYIDGCHVYESVRQDIELYHDKLKEGGILCGHDIEIHGVINAVMEFVAKKGIQINLIGGEWWFYKK